MSVVIMTKFQVDASVLEELANGRYSDTLQRVAEVGKQGGAIHHRFIQDTDGTLIALDEWESEDAFHRFFESEGDIQQIMRDAGVTEPPASTTYRIIEAPDAF